MIWSAAPSPITVLQRDKPIPSGLPSKSISLLNNNFAIGSLEASGHLPTHWSWKPPDAPKWSIVWYVFEKFNLIPPSLIDPNFGSLGSVKSFSQPTIMLKISTNNICFFIINILITRVLSNISLR